MKALIRKLIKASILYIFVLQLSIPIFIYPRSDDIIEQINILLDQTDARVDENIPIVKSSIEASKGEKDWTLILYISADNDLRNFAIRNIKQMAKIGSNQNINIVVHLDIKLSGNKKATKRYYIDKNKIIHVNSQDQHSQRMDSGSPKTLISCCKWAINNFPAKHYGLILWNHGTGALDPRRGRVIRLADLFTFNPEINKVELDRSINFMEFLSRKTDSNRGICWDDTTGNYLTNQDLDHALGVIYKNILKKKKLDFIAFDACLMQMIEVASIIKKYANIMIASQEVILGTGFNYVETLKPFQTQSLTTQEFAKHIIKSYEKTYSRVTNDFTLSALDLSMMEKLEENLDDVAKTLVFALKKQKNKTVKKAIAASRSKLVCTHFDEPSFIDLHHLYKNLLLTMKHMKLKNRNDEEKFKKILTYLLTEGYELIEKMALARTAGKNLSKAKGISIYFPTRRIYFSYRNLTFCKKHNWILFLTQYLNS